MGEPNARGFMGYAEFKDSYGAEIRVQESSAAMGPHVWVWTKGGGIVQSGGVNDGSAHLDLQQAAKLRDALDEFIRESVGRWENIGAHMTEELREATGVQWLRVATDPALPKHLQQKTAREAFIQRYGGTADDLTYMGLEEYEDGAEGVWDVQRIAA